MQDYVALRIAASPCNEDITDLLAAFLGDEGYESFTSDQEGLTAYIRSDIYDENKVKAILAEFPIPSDLSFSYSLVKGEDWNEEWEKHYFKPIVVDGQCVVHSSFHRDVPSAPYDIVIDPKMAFGTGHHSTTYNMMRLILRSDMSDKSVIDMGTGTGILAILCKMRGAGVVTGIEIDPFACENAEENVRLNHVAVNMICGDAKALDGLGYADYFLANINRNVITSDISRYAKALKPGGEMFLSGFYEDDIPVIAECVAPHGLSIKEKAVDNNWVALRVVKND